MFHPDILRQVVYLRTEGQCRLIDACADAAQFYGVDAVALIDFCRTIGMH